MNEELPLNEQQLTLATSRSLPSDASLDRETALARDGFLSLGSVVERPAGHFDTATLLARLQESCAATSVPARPRREAGRDWLAVVLTGALAAAGLFAIVRVATDPGTARQPLAKMEHSAQVPRFDESEIAGNQSTFANEAVTWNDPLDEEIALASARIEQFTSRGRGFDDSLLDMNDQLKALSQELTNETL